VDELGEHLLVGGAVGVREQAGGGQDVAGLGAALAKNSGNLSGSAGTFVLAPTHTVNGKLVLDATMAAPLWTAVKQDSIAAFAQQHRSVLTPATVP
jgi:hypothetical protein